MVAVVSGNGLGLFTTSLGQLGSTSGGSAGIGQGRDAQFVNVATGNVLLTAMDESLFGRGFATGLMRTYNSQGSFAQTGTDGWLSGYERTVRLVSGTVNTSGSLVERATADGSLVSYTWSSTRAAYVSMAGEGAHDTITRSGSGSTAKWQWTEGSSQVQETYDASVLGTAGRLEKIADLVTGAAYTLDYSTANQLTITGANSEALVLNFSGGKLDNVQTRERNLAGVLETKSQVSYGYDGAGRLSWVQTDLTPDITTDNTWNDPAAPINDNKRFRTTYIYENSTSLRIAQVSTSDGVSVAYAYDGSGRVSTVTQGSAGDGSAQILTYAYGAGTTTVTDGASRQWTYQFDGSGQLTAVLGPAVNGQRPVSNYTYDTSGNVVQISQAAYVGASATLDTVFKYDTNGNVLLQRDRLGNTIERTYNAANRILTEAVYTTPDADGLDPTHVGTTNLPGSALVTRYVYDTINLNQLRFVINAAGEVSESQYNTTGVAIGQVSSTRRFLANAYDISALGNAAVPTLTQMTTWIVGKLGQASRADVSYDAQGRVKQTVAYATVDGSGAGQWDDAATVANFIYDAQGLLRQQVLVRGATRTLAGAVLGGSEVSDYVYDGMGRLRSVIRRDVGTASNDDANALSTTTSYLDSQYQLQTTMDSGAVRTELRNAAGLLVSISEAGIVAGSTVTRTTQNFYDATGRLRATQDASGARSYLFYDVAGRLTATVDATGAVTETRYDAIGRAVQTVAYGTLVDTSTWFNGTAVTKDTLVFATTAPALLGGQVWVKIDAAMDRSGTRTFDSAGRLATEVDVTGLTTTYAYDGASRLLSTTIGKAGETSRITRAFYDAASRPVATLDAAGYLTESVFDAGGRLIKTIRYAALTNSAYWANGSLAQLRPAVNATQDQTTRYFYDARGNQVGVLSAEGYLTEFVVDEARNQRAVKAYAKQLTGLTGSEALLALHDAALLSPPTEPWRLTQRSFDGLGQLTAELNAEGTVTRYYYDDAGRLVRTESAQGTSEVRDNYARYDVFGQLIGELSGQQAADAMLAFGVTSLTVLDEEQRNSAYSTYGITHSYDLRGQRIESVDAKGTDLANLTGNKTWYFYDAAGRSTFTVRGVKDDNGLLNAQGEITETRYTAFGQVSDSLTYTGRISIGGTQGRADVLTTISTLGTLSALGSSARQFAYDQRGMLRSSIDATGAVTQSSYTAFGQLFQSTRAFGTANAVTTQYTYDVRGLQTSRIVAVGVASVTRTVGQTMDAFGRVVSATDARGTVTTFTYDRQGRQLTQSRTVDGQTETSSLSYDAFDRVVTQTDGRGQPTTYVHSDLNRSVKVISPEGVAITTTRNRFGQTVTVSQTLPDTSSATTTYDYDKNGDLIRTTNPLYQVTGNAYDVRRLLAESTDASGRKVKYTYDAVGRVISRVEDPGAGKLNLTTTYVYDGQGRQLRVTDASGRVTAMSYDGEGRLILTARDPSGLSLLTSYSYDTLGRQVTVTEGLGTSAARTVQYTYDGLNRRLSEIVDPGAGKLNLTTQYSYDANDNVVTRTDALGNKNRYVYDEANRLRFVIDALGGLTETTTDKNGNVILGRRYAKALTAPSLVALGNAPSLAAVRTQVVSQALKNDAADQLSYRVLDSDNRVRFTVDAVGTLTETRYDTAGRVKETLAYAKAITTDTGLLAKLRAGTAVLADFDTFIGSPANQTNIRASTYLYDAAGRVIYTVTRSSSNDGVVNERRYDAAGRVIADVSYATTIAYPVSQTASLIATALTSTATLQRLTQYAHDGAGRLRYTMDDAGVVREQRYDGAGNVIATLQYLLPISTTLSGEAAITAAVSSQQGMARQTSYAYDTVGRLVGSTDALNQTETYGYDALSQRISMTNKLGAVWNYEYDKAGRLVTERSPAIHIARYDAEGNVVTYFDSIVTRSTYDALGQVLNRTENADATDIGERRTTQYVYDARGRKIKTIFPNAWELDANGVLVASAGALPEIAITYDALDRAVVQKDVRLNHSYKVYDALGRVAYDIDAAGYVTAYGYSTYGEQTTLTRYANKIDFSKLTGWTAGSEITLSQITLGEAANTFVITTSSVADRVLSTNYDQLGRKAAISQPAVSYITANGPAGTGSPRTEFTYDAYGNLVKEAQLLRGTPGVDAEWANTFRYYDELGRQVLSVDAEGYVSRTVYDAIGQVIEATEFARAMATASLAAGSPPLWPATGDTSTGYDRVTRWSYDTLGRKASETVVRHYQLVDGAAAVRDVVTLLGYDAADRLTQATVDGVETATYYDAIGRVTAVKEAERDVLRSDAETLLTNNAGLTLESTALYERASPYTAMAYDAFGHVIRTVRYANGVRAGYVYEDATRDQVSTVRYDRQGRAVIEIDAVGNAVYHRYDAADNAVESWYYLDGNDGRRQIVRSTANFDANGQQTNALTQREAWRTVYGVVSPTATTLDSVENVVYNAFGEVIGKGFDGSSTPLQFVYDAAGRLTGSNAEGGVWRTYSYNLAGHQVRESHQTLVLGNAVTATTNQTTDKLGRATRIVLPSYSDTLANTSTVNQRYDRWGNVVEVIDPRGYQTTYEYNELNQAVRELKPLVKVVSESGVETWQHPETRWYYDALGRLLAERDANGNVHRSEYDAIGRQIRSRDAYGFASRQAFDALGNQRLTQDGAGYVTYRGFDRAGRVIEQGDFLPNIDGSRRDRQAIERYTLNQNGDRLVVRNALDQTAKYDYDGRHLLLRSQSTGGIITEYAYDSQGRKVLEVNALAKPEFGTYLTPVYNGGLVTDFTAILGQAIAPYMIPEAAITVPSGETISYSLEVRRYNPATYAYEVANNSGLVFTANTLSGTVTVAGNYQLILTATTPSGKTLTKTMSLFADTAAALGGKPTLAIGIPDQILVKDVAWSYQFPIGSFVDPQSQALTYDVQIRYWVPPSGTPKYPEDYEPGYWDYRPLAASDWVKFNATTRTFSGTSAVGGNTELILTATDPNGNQASTLFNVRVQVPGGGRIAVADGEGTASTLDDEIVYQHEQSWNYDAFGRLIDHNDLSGVDYNYGYDATTGQATTQSNGWTSSSTVTVLSPLTIGGVTLLVPTTQSITGASTRSLSYFANGLLEKLNEGASTYRYEYDAAGNRTVEDSTTYDVNGSLVHLRTRMTYDSHNRVERVVQDDLVTGKRVLDLTYSYDANGNRRRVIATGAYQDGVASIANVNQAPIVVGTPENLTLRSAVATTFRLRLTDIFRDPELDPLSIVAQQVIGGANVALPNWLTASVDAATGELVFTATTGSNIDNNKDLTLQLTATDPSGASKSVSFVLAVRSNSVPQVLGNGTPNFPVTLLKQVTLELAANTYFRDIDLGDSLTLTVVGGSLPPGMTGGATSPPSSVLRFSGTPTTAGLYALTIMATDQQGASVTRTITIDARTNHAPTAVAQAGATMIAGRIGTWDRTLASVFADSDGDALSLVATLVDGSVLPSWLSFDVVHGADGAHLQLVGTPPSYVTDGSTITVKLQATDPQGQSASTTLTITLRQNQAPSIVSPLPTQTLRVNQLTPYALEVPLSSLFADPEGDALDISFILPNGDPTGQWLTMQVDHGAGKLLLGGIPTDNLQAGTHTLQVRARDASGLTVTMNVTFDIKTDNAPVYVSGIDNRTLGASRNFTFSFAAGSFADVDALQGDVLTYSAFEEVPVYEEVWDDYYQRWEQVYAGTEWAALPSWISFDAATRTFSGTAPGTIGMVSRLMVMATDTLNRTAERVFDVSVVAVTNQAPVYAAGTLINQTAIETQPVDFALPVNAFSDGNGDVLTYSAQIQIGATWVNLPLLGLSMNASTGRITGTLTGPTQTSYSIKVIASDGLASANGTFTMSVNLKPIVAVAIPLRTAVVNTFFSYSFDSTTFSDPNGSALTYSASGMPSWMAFNATTRTFSGTPTSTGPVSVTVTASDGVLSVSTTLSITVNATAGNQLPVVTVPLDDLWLVKYTPFTVTFPANSFTDPDGQSLTYTAVAVTSTGGAASWPSWLTFNAGTRTFSGSPSNLITRYIKVTATDAGGASISDTFTIFVEAAGTQSSQTFVGGSAQKSAGGASAQMLPGDGDPEDPPPGGGGGSTPTAAEKGYWFTYDAENRVKIVNGALTGGVITHTTDDSSYTLNYDASGRMASRMVKVNGADMLEVSRYDLRGQLLYVFQPIALNAATPSPGTAGALKEARVYDALGRLLEQVVYYGAGETRNNLSIAGWRKHSDRYEYNLDGQVIRQVSRGRLLGWQPYSSAISHEASDAALVDLSIVQTTFDKLGRSSGYTFQYLHHEADYTGQAADPVGFTHTYGISYQGRDGYLEKQVWGHSSNSNFKASTSESLYDGWGRRVGIREKTPLPSNYGTLSDRVRYFAYDGEGGILRRREGSINSNNAFVQSADDLKKDELYSYANGQQVAKQTRGGNLELRTKLAAYQESGYAKGSAKGLGMNGFEALRGRMNGSSSTSSRGSGVVLEDAVTRLTDYTSGPMGMSTVQVNSGDTLQAIAQRVYGNAGLWYVIADANAIGSNAELVPGTSLRVPSVRVSANDAGTFKPYNPAEIVGNTSPGLPYIEPPKEAGCSFLANLIRVVAIVLSNYIPLLGQMLIEGIAQTVEIHQGYREGYNPGAIVAAGVPGVSTGQPVLDAVIMAVRRYEVGYVVNKALGVEDHFSWKALAATAVTAALTAKLFGPSAKDAAASAAAEASGQVREGFTGTFNWTAATTAAVKSVGRAAVGYAVNKAITGQAEWSWGQVAMNAVGEGLYSGLTTLKAEKIREEKKLEEEVQAKRMPSNANGGIASAQKYSFDTDIGHLDLSPFGGGDGMAMADYIDPQLQREMARRADFYGSLKSNRQIYDEIILERANAIETRRIDIATAMGYRANGGVIPDELARKMLAYANSDGYGAASDLNALVYCSANGTELSPALVTAMTLMHSDPELSSDYAAGLLTRGTKDALGEMRIQSFQALLGLDPVGIIGPKTIAALTSAFSRHSQIAIATSSVIQEIGDVISHGEGGYESYNTGTIGGRVKHSYLRPAVGTITSKTINEILASAALSADDPNRLFATGKYQTIEPTLRAAKVKMGLSGNELYDAAMQERVFAEFLFEKAGGGKLAAYVLRGTGTVDDAMYAASKEWASIAVPNGMNISGGRSISNGTLSYYESRANHANMSSTNTLQQLLARLGR